MTEPDYPEEEYDWPDPRPENKKPGGGINCTQKA